jgi:hypothetical protein
MPEDHTVEMDGKTHPMAPGPISWDIVRSELFRMEHISPLGKGAKGPVLSCAQRCLELAEKLIAPRVVTAVKPVSSITSDSITLTGGIVLKSTTLPSHMKGAEGLIFFLATIGDGLEKRASGFIAKSDDPLSGYLLDRIGSIAVESLAQEVENSLRKDIEKKAKSLSMRFSPGYCDWPIEEQFKVSKLLDFSKAGVHLTEKCVMVPKKSISAACAVGPKGVFTDITSPCSICNLDKCDYRRS